MRRLLVVVLAALAAAVFAAGPAFAVSAHWVSATVTSVSSNSITVSFKEAGLGKSLNSVNITLSATAECINVGNNHPKAANKESFSVSGTFNVSNGNATGSLTDSAATISPPCSPPMVIAWTDVTLTDTTFNDTTTIPGTFYPGG